MASAVTDWRSLPIIERHEYMMRNEILTDCTFVVGGSVIKEFRAHKLILSEASEVFTAMLQVADTDTVRIKEFQPETFSKLLEYAYTDQVGLANVEEAMDLCLAAEKYLIKRLVIMCVNYIITNMHPNQVCKIFELANMISNSALQDLCLEKMREKTEEIILADSFMKADASTIQTMLKQDTLTISSEAILFSTLHRWGNHGSNDIKQVMQLCIPHVRFRTLTINEFENATKYSNLLNEWDKLQIAACINGEKNYMPMGFTDNWCKRETFSHKLSIAQKSIDTIEQQYFYLKFKINDKDINLCGIELHERSHNDENKNDVVREEMKMWICENESLDNIPLCNFDGSRTLGSKLAFEFLKPYLAKQSNTYCITIALRNKTMYPKLLNAGATYSTTSSGDIFTLDFSREYYFNIVTAIYYKFN